ncbi:MAG: hypothetical protein CR982_01435 [Candidatus Cloacimonadota bacterium]|nr:MAG: hypothetical protein CR982_01435 [Candidatus Cloacimonadota bacterium]PIE79565.1 MAG: hypothetical protein CSA15_02790 [Candidatus Delongbacteria bacterium]
MKNIFLYEFKQLIRDKKTLFFTFILPVILFPVINGGFSLFTKSRIEKLKSENITVLYNCNENKGYGKRVVDNLTDSTLTFKNIELDLFSDSLLLEYPVFLNIKKDSTGKDLLEIKYSSKKEKMNILARTFIGKMRKFQEKETSLFFKSLDVNDFTERRKIESENLASREKTNRNNSSTSIPLSIVLILFFGTYFIASYAIVGERDNKTLETLLTSGIERKSVIYGKLFLIILSGMVVSVLELTSFYIYSSLSFGSIDISLSFNQTILLALATFIISIFMASLVTIVSARIKSSSTGQVIVTPLMVIVALLSFAGTSSGINLEKGILLIPILNGTALIKAIIMDSVTIFQFLAVTIVSVGYSIFMLRSTIKYLGSENVLDSDINFESMRSSEDKTSFAIISYLFIFVIYMVLGSFLQSKDIVSGLIISQIFLLGLPALFLAKIGMGSYIKPLKFNSFKIKYLIIAIFFGLFGRFAISIVSIAFSYLFPIPDMGSSEAMIKLFGKFSMLEAIALIAVVPAIFEELVFRGTITDLMRNSKRSDIVTSLIVGVFFGFMHMQTFTIVETSLLGVIITYITLKSGSIFPAMILHFINNGVSVFMAKNSDQHWMGIMGELESSGNIYYTGAIVLFIFIAWYISEERYEK